MAGFLRFVGAVFIVAGVFGGLLLIASADWGMYDRAQTVYQRLPDNPYSQAEYAMQRSKITVAVAGGVAAGFSGLASGLVFLALARVIELGEASQAVLRDLAATSRGTSPGDAETIPGQEPAVAG